ncbi:copper chaperone NosL [Fontibacillus phaseoli]|uniref:Copper chaperone NosL n=1 Tax=Fontibacillus phaseoli TaxID=1416533 RepID=A0A369BRS0_9BACL|nr:nitrous oxide reductase accessory protein NosL [Fontibacillus phaseoli]RCX23745.1 copper chaperone NosL [Fontibacillus phaseoli]
MKKGFVALSFILVLIVVAGCGKKTYQPQAINEDVDVCVICNMQVKDDAFATQIVTKEGKSLKFDDIGCMNEWKSQNGTDEIGMAYVRDYNDKEWIEYEKAAYVYDASIRTPMAYGLVSFKDKKSAEQFIQEQSVGQLLSSEDLANHKWEQSKGMMDMDMHMHDDGDAHGNSHEHDENRHEDSTGH